MDSWQRSEDYYSEGALVWLDVDTLIRERSNGQKSLDDFARAFFGIDNGSSVPVTYQFDDVMKTLNGVSPYDWASFPDASRRARSRRATDGITRGGYKLVFNDTPSDFFRAAEGNAAQMGFSLGATISGTGQVTAVTWDRRCSKRALYAGSRSWR